MRQINLIVVHCSATPPDMDIGAKEIRKWHTDPKPKGRGWDDVGYHRIIRRDGTIEPGRDIVRAGAHAYGHNRNSIGICLVGGCRRVGKELVTECNFTPEQYAALKHEVQHFLREFPGARLLGHRDLDNGKDCPTFSVKDWALREGVLKPGPWK